MHTNCQRTLEIKIPKMDSSELPHEWVNNIRTFYNDVKCKNSRNDSLSAGTLWRLALNDW
jgi:hypothetical protein